MKLQVSIAMFVPLLLAALLSTNCEAQDLNNNFTSAVKSGEPNWYPYVLARGSDRTVIQNTPITGRPYRPMHFYGNAVRRAHFRGTPAPMPRDFVRSASTVLLRR